MQHSFVRKMLQFWANRPENLLKKLILMKTIYVFLFLAVILTGFNAGMGFANAVGYMPATQITPANHLLSFWQNADHFFRARMPFFGNTMILTLLVSLFLLRHDWKSAGFWLIAIAFVIAAGELVVILTQNLPINKVLETLDAEMEIPPSFEQMRQKAISAFYTRSVLSIIAFILTTAGVMWTCLRDAAGFR